MRRKRYALEPALGHSSGVWSSQDRGGSERALASDLLDHVFGRHYGAFLPAGEGGDLISYHVEPAVGCEEPRVSLGVIVVI